MHAWINITHPGFSDAETVIDEREDEWIPWEQMVATLRSKGEAEGRAAMLAREVIELRGEVAKLKPLEFLLLKGGDPVQHLSEAVLDLSAKVRQMEEASRLDQSEILRLTRCVAEVIHARLMVAKIDVQGMQSLADSITDQEMRDPAQAEKVWCEKINAWFCEHSSAIGMDALAKLRDDFNEWAISRATGSAELEHQKADALWKTWRMIDIPTSAVSVPETVADAMEARAVVAPESDEVESLRDTVRFLASVVSKGAQIRHQIIFSLHENKPDEAKDYAMMKWPIIQGAQNQIDLEKVGKQAYTPKRIRLAVDSLLGIRANQGGAAT